MNKASIIRDDDKGPYNAVDIAKCFVLKAREERKFISVRRLNYYVYFAHAWHLAFTGKPLIKEEVQVWSSGPVIFNIYHYFFDDVSPTEGYEHNMVRRKTGDKTIDTWYMYNVENDYMAGRMIDYYRGIMTDKSFAELEPQVRVRLQQAKRFGKVPKIGIFRKIMNILTLTHIRRVMPPRAMDIVYDDTDLIKA